MAKKKQAKAKTEKQAKAKEEDKIEEIGNIELIESKLVTDYISSISICFLTGTLFGIVPNILPYYCWSWEVFYSE